MNLTCYFQDMSEGQVCDVNIVWIRLQQRQDGAQGGHYVAVRQNHS
jgi:hypothetical protein